MYHAYHFLVSTIPQLNYLAAAFLLGRWLARQSNPNLSLAGTALLCLAVPLAGSPLVLEELGVVPFVVIRYARALLVHIWPAAAYDTFELERDMFVTSFSLFWGELRSWENRVIGGVASFNTAIMALALATAFFVRALIPAAAQERARNWMPPSWNPLWRNPWPAPGKQRIWDINLCIIALCLLPVIVVGPLVAIYLRVRASHLLWPATWIAAIWSLSRLVGGVAHWLLFRVMDSKTVVHALESASPAANPALLKKAVGFSFFYAMPELIAALGLAFICCLTLPLTQRKQRDWRWLGVLLFCAACFQMLWGGWLPDTVGGGQWRLEDLEQLFTSPQ